MTFAAIDSAAGAYDVSGLDDNKRADAGEFLPRVDRAAMGSRDHHACSGSRHEEQRGRGRYAIGSERKLGTVDVHLGLEPVRPLHRGRSGLVRVATHKDRPAHLPRPRAAELELHSDPDTHQISWAFKPAEAIDAETREFRPTYLMEKVSRFLEGVNSDGATRSRVEEAVQGKAEYVRLAMDTLLKEGYAAEIPGRGRRLASVKPFRDSEPVPESVPAPNPPLTESVPNPSRKGKANPARQAKSNSSQSVPNPSRDEYANPSPRPPLYRGDGDELEYDQDELDRLESLGESLGLT